jgi:hypothetical protein
MDNVRNPSNSDFLTCTFSCSGPLEYEIASKFRHWVFYFFILQFTFIANNGSWTLLSNTGRFVMVRNHYWVNIVFLRRHRLKRCPVIYWLSFHGRSMSIRNDDIHDEQNTTLTADRFKLLQDNGTLRFVLAWKIQSSPRDWNQSGGWCHKEKLLFREHAASTLEN